MKKEKGKIIKKILSTCIYVVVIVCFLYNVLFLINTAIYQKDYLKIFGTTLFNMNSNQMKDDINSGDLVVIKHVEKKHLKNGDIIAYNFNGKTRINKIIKQDKEGYTTKSNKNYNTEIKKVEYNQIIGKMTTKISRLGFVISILQSNITSVCIILFLILYFLYNKYLFAKKQERAKKKNG